MTEKQAKALKFIDGFIKEKGFSPSQEEIRVYMGIKSKSGANRLVHSLAEHGKVKVLKFRARSIEVAN